MGVVKEINGVLVTSISEWNGIPIGHVADINGQQIPSGSAAISFDDMTHLCVPNTTISNALPFNVPLPSTAQVGDLVFFFIEADFPFTGDNFTYPTGWTKVFNWNGSTSDTIGSGLWKILDAADVAAGVVPVGSAVQYTSRDIHSWSWICTNVDTTTPISDVGSWSQSAGTSKTIAGITPSANGLAVGFWGFDGGDGEPTTITSGWTKIAEQECDGGSSGTFAGFASLATVSGTPTGNLVVTALTSDGWGGIIINFKQA